MSTTVTVYTKPDCPQCTATKKALKKHGVEFDELPIDDDVLNRAQLAGITSAPIVEAIGHAPWGGFRPDKIKSLAA